MSTVQQSAPAVCPDAAHMGEHACTNRAQCWEPCGELGHSEEHAQAIHPDDEAVDRFAAVLKDKLTVARAKGRGGWQDKAEVTADELTDMLVGHLWKGDPRDVANFCMFLWERGERITLADNQRMERAAEAFGIAEAKCAEHHAAAGRLIAPSISTEAGLLAAAPLPGEPQFAADRRRRTGQAGAAQGAWRPAPLPGTERHQQVRRPERNPGHRRFGSAGGR